MSVKINNSTKTFLLWVGGILFGSFLLAVILIGQRNPYAFSRTAFGSRMAPIEAQGWINGEAPEAKDLKGKVLVVEAWATWCLPCRQRVPEMIYLFEKYSPQGVVFIGLTDQPREDADEIRGFLSESGVTWLNGFGANRTLEAMNVDRVPVTWVVDRQGNVVWTEGMTGTLEQSIRLALASK